VHGKVTGKLKELEKLNLSFKNTRIVQTLLDKNVITDDVSHVMEKMENISNVFIALRETVEGALNVHSALKKAKEAIEEGKNPVITFSKTGESFIKSKKAELNLKIGQPIPAKMNDYFLKEIDNVLSVKLKNKNGQSVNMISMLKKATDKESKEILKNYEKIKKEIYDMDLSDLPVSPMDWLAAQLEKGGIDVRIMSGRQNRVKYDKKGNITLESAMNETKDAKRLESIESFQNDKSALIMTDVGGTGIELHATSKKGKERVMIIVDPPLVASNFEQLIHRVHRKGATKNSEVVLFMGGQGAQREMMMVFGRLIGLGKMTNAQEGKLVKELEKLSNTVPHNRISDEAAKNLLKNKDFLDYLKDSGVDIKSSRKNEYAEINRLSAMIITTTNKEISDKLNELLRKEYHEVRSKSEAKFYKVGGNANVETLIPSKGKGHGFDDGVYLVRDEAGRPFVIGNLMKFIAAGSEKFVISSKKHPDLPLLMHGENSDVFHRAIPLEETLGTKVNTKGNLVIDTVQKVKVALENTDYNITMGKTLSISKAKPSGYIVTAVDKTVAAKLTTSPLFENDGARKGVFHVSDDNFNIATQYLFKEGKGGENYFIPSTKDDQDIIRKAFKETIKDVETIEHYPC